MPKRTTTLYINALELRVHLGWTDKELSKKQLVYLDVAILFNHIPKACITDHLDGTLCYKDLIDIIHKKLSSKKFRLIERLTAEVYRIINETLPAKCKLDVSITKYPKVNGLDGGVSFRYGDS
jgi:dihydroneopterin aldolase